MMEIKKPAVSMIFTASTHDEHATRFSDGLSKVIGSSNPSFEILTFEQMLDWNVNTGTFPGDRIRDHRSNGHDDSMVPGFICMAALKEYLDASIREKGLALKAAIIFKFPLDEGRRALLMQCHPEATFFPIRHAKAELDDNDLCRMVMEFIEHMKLPPGSSEIRKALKTNWGRWADGIPGSPHDRELRRKSASVVSLISESSRHWDAPRPELVCTA